MRDWPIWSCEVSRFAWTYDAQEICLLLEGLSCLWEVKAPARKHYRFG
ncbi:MAG: cupin domain-containing protein [Cyanobacteriota bacterium]|nr:cupin domain-containing protein [Cyanobacteriota bacterium]